MPKPLLQSWASANADEMCSSSRNLSILTNADPSTRRQDAAQFLRGYGTILVESLANFRFESRCVAKRFAHVPVSNWS